MSYIQTQINKIIYSEDWNTTNDGEKFTDILLEGIHETSNNISIIDVNRILGYNKSINYNISAIKVNPNTIRLQYVILDEPILNENNIKEIEFSINKGDICIILDNSNNRIDNKEPIPVCVYYLLKQ